MAQDPELGAIDTVHGRVTFVQVVGVTDEEREAASMWNAHRLLDLAAQRNPKLVTDLQRPSWFEDPAFRRAFEMGRAIDGSTTALDHVSQLGWTRTGDQVQLRIGALAARSFPHVLRGRLLFGHSYRLVAAGLEVEFRPGDSWSAEEPEEGRLVLRMSREHVGQLAQEVVAKRGTFALGPLTIVVEPTPIRDSDGNIVQTIG